MVAFCVVCGVLKRESKHICMELAAEGAFSVVTSLMRAYPLDVAVQQVCDPPSTCRPLVVTNKAAPPVKPANPTHHHCRPGFRVIFVCSRRWQMREDKMHLRAPSPQAGCGALGVIGSSTATHAVALSSGAVHTALFSLRDPLLAVELRAAAAEALCPFCESPATARAILEAGALDVRGRSLACPAPDSTP